MEQGQIQHLQAADIDQNPLDTDALASDIDNLFDDLQGIIRDGRNQRVNANFNPEDGNNELRPFDEEVSYQQNENVVEQRSQYINALEQDRMQKLRQKQTLLNLNREKIDATNDGRTYTRNLDEGVMLNATKKELSQQALPEPNIQPKDAVLEEEIVGVLPSSEEFEEEFLNMETKATRDYQKKQQEPGDDRDDPQDSADQQVALEDDEIIDLDSPQEMGAFYGRLQQELNGTDLDVSEDEISQRINRLSDDDDIQHRILTIASRIDRKEGKEANLTRDIERRIKRASIFNKKNARTEPRQAPPKVNKLKAKFGRNR